jgi:hypothetical protein
MPGIGLDGTGRRLETALPANERRSRPSSLRLCVRLLSKRPKLIAFSIELTLKANPRMGHRPRGYNASRGTMREPGWGEDIAKRRKPRHRWRGFRNFSGCQINDGHLDSIYERRRRKASRLAAPKSMLAQVEGSGIAAAV